MNCEALHARSKESLASFRELLVPIGIQRFGHDLPSLEMANCPHCHTTLAFEVAGLDAVALPKV